MRSAYEISRRTVIKGMAGLAGATSLGRPALAASRAIKIGVVVPQSGPLALFAENTGFVVGQVNKVLGGQIKIGGTNRPATRCWSKISQSSPTGPPKSPSISS